MDDIIERSHYGWLYKLKRGNNDFDFEIAPNKILKKPEFLCKYYSLSENDLSSFEKEQFYVSQPHDFNDLFDSNFLRINFNGLTLNDAHNLTNNFIHTELEGMFQNNYPQFIEHMRMYWYKQLLSQVGILCLTPNSLNELMWAYYNNNEGFCLEFDYSKFSSNFKGPYPVNYIDQLKEIKFKDLDTYFSMILLLTTKKYHWHHEEEYRYIVRPPIHGQYFRNTKPFEYHSEIIERLIPFPNKSLKSIILGFNFLKNEEFKMEDDSTYTVKFISDKKEFKKRLFNKIIENQLTCYNIVQERPTFVLEKEKWEITLIENYEYKIYQTSLLGI